MDVKVTKSDYNSYLIISAILGTIGAILMAYGLSLLLNGNYDFWVLFYTVFGFLLIPKKQVRRYIEDLNYYRNLPD